MPRAQTNSTFNARRFAALLAGFDTGNGSEEEAITKGLALRRMASRAGMRIVDLLEVPEVRAAIDAQLSPKRKPDPALKEALELTSALQEELTDRTRDARKLAESLRQQKERTEELSRELRAARSVRSHASRTSAASPVISVASPPAPRTPSHLARFDWRDIPLPDFKAIFIVTGVGALLWLLIVAFGFVISHTGGNGNGLGHGQGISPSGLYQDGELHAVPKHGAVHHRVHRGGTTNRPR